MAALMVGILILVSGGFVVALAGRQVHDFAKTSSSNLYALVTSPSERGDDVIARAVKSGLVLKHRSVVGLEVDRKRWSAAPKAERERLLTALTHSAFGRELRGAEVVAVYAGKGRTPLAVRRATDR